MYPPTKRWCPQIRWETPAGRLLDQALDALPTDKIWELTVFGSAPLQLGLDPSFLSADVDVICEEGEIQMHLERGKLLKGQTDFYIEVVPSYVFQAPSDWRQRAHFESRRHGRFIFPHPADILVAKVCRVAEKDLNAFRLVRRLTGHPTPDEMIHLLRKAVDIYRPRFDEERATDPFANTILLWHEIFGAEIDVRREIIQPALEERRRYFEQGKGLRDTLRAIGESGGTN